MNLCLFSQKWLSRFILLMVMMMIFTSDNSFALLRFCDAIVPSVVVEWT